MFGELDAIKEKLKTVNLPTYLKSGGSEHSSNSAEKVNKVEKLLHNQLPKNLLNEGRKEVSIFKF